MPLTIGKIRGLQQIANQHGIFTICAMDHRGSLSKILCQDKNDTTCYQEMVSFKLELCRNVARYASAVLLDPIYGAAQCISHGVIPRGTGLLVSIEATGYEGNRENRVTRLLEEWSVAKIKRMGATAVKMLVYYRPDLTELAARQRDTISAVARDCTEHDIPFLVEPLSYPVGNEVSNPGKFAARKEQLVIQTASDISSLPIDVLKAEFPSNLNCKTDEAELLALCQELDRSSRVPWVILSAGVSYELFRWQVEIACRGGASGFLAGRAIWQEATDIASPGERGRYLATVATERLKKLVEIANKYAVPWYQKLELLPDKLAHIDSNWYVKY